MFYDLNVPWTSATDPELPRLLAFLAELGYSVVALNHTPSGKLPAELPCAIPSPLPFAVPPSLAVLRRLTLPLASPLSNARLKALGAGYDLLALRPADEKTLQAACATLEADIISLDLTQRLGFHFKFKPLSEAVRRGVRLEVGYAAGVVEDANARRNVISNVMGLVRASRGRGLVVSSEAKRAVACRGPWDVINLLAVWGLKQEIAFEAVSKEARSVVVQAGIKKSGWRGVVDIVHAGEAEQVAESQAVKTNGDARTNGTKRKAEAIEPATDSAAGGEQPISKREMKRRAKKAREANLP